MNGIETLLNNPQLLSNDKIAEAITKALALEMASDIAGKILIGVCVIGGLYFFYKMITESPY